MLKRTLKVLLLPLTVAIPAGIVGFWMGTPTMAGIMFIVFYALGLIYSFANECLIVESIKEMKID